LAKRGGVAALSAWPSSMTWLILNVGVARHRISAGWRRLRRRGLFWRHGISENGGVMAAAYRRGWRRLGWLWPVIWLVRWYSMAWRHDVSPAAAASVQRHLSWRRRLFWRGLYRLAWRGCVAQCGSAAAIIQLKRGWRHMIGGALQYICGGG